MKISLYEEWLKHIGSECPLYCCPKHGCMYPQDHEHDNALCPVS